MGQDTRATAENTKSPATSATAIQLRTNDTSESVEFDSFGVITRLPINTTTPTPMTTPSTSQASDSASDVDIVGSTGGVGEDDWTREGLGEGEEVSRKGMSSPGSESTKIVCLCAGATT
jgi:hypothetical protein